MAAVARDVLGLDRVFLSPARHPPHKRGADTTGYRDRVAMTEAAAAGEDGVFVTAIEDRDQTSYTVDLLRACRARTAADLYFILGADSFAELSSWRDAPAIVRLATLVVFPRRTAPEGVVRATVAGAGSFVVFEGPVIDASSSDVRARLARGEAGGDAIAPAVADYIARRGIYART
jgi:nicotinate-nucleotide adenylyltransferase